MIAYVVLAAGSARRMGFAKATTPLAGTSPLERLAGVLAGKTFTVVTSVDQREACERALPGIPLVVNHATERGMTSSLSLASAAIDARATVGVLLADKPFVTGETLDRCERALGACDVLYATTNGESGHPVYFAPAARALLAALPDGDTLRTLRDDSRLRRLAIACDDDPGVALDLDTPEAWREAERRITGA